MQNQHNNPVLIFAQSGRFLAQSAAQAGLPVWVADYFGDQDTLSIAKRWHQLPVLSELNDDSILNVFSELTNGEKCSLICGNGIEYCYALLEQLPDNIQLVGNTAHTINTIKKPTLFFGLLDQLNIAYPETQFEHPGDNKIWLTKSASGLGGGHIHYLDQQANLTGYYFQRFIRGASGSGLFLANGKQAQLISINKQNCTASKQSPFLLSSVETPWSISDRHIHQLEQIIIKLTPATGLVGLNSLDFIISEQNELLVLEINPRPSSSAELIDLNSPLFQHHVDACRGILPNEPIIRSASKTSLRYLYANADWIIPADIIWPSECHDLPAMNTLIKKQEPICTSIVQASSGQDVNYLHQDIENRVANQLQKLEK
ncbi:MAG: hypothetical protein DRQ46_01300 [Gammaproteobacteria bacterium]|nr:MAG: hypothetical protein DRQ46_01300 [Gammaproteobacteria bacterium]